MKEARSRIRVLIVDDEPAAHAWLEDLLSEEDDIEIVGAIRTSREALRALEELEPDLVFLDVQMPGMTGLDIVQKVGPDRMPMVVFVTAYDRYALDAFEVAAIDYLLKPFGRDRFEQTLARARKALKARELDDLQERLVTLVQHVSHPAGGPVSSPAYLKRITVEMRGHIRIVPVHQIDFITASGSYAEVHTGTESFLINEQMQALEAQLDPEQFFRIHRSTIVQLDRIESLLVGAGADYAACIAGGRRLKVSRNRWDALVERLGFGFQTP